MKTIENINEIHIQKSIVFLYIGNDQLDIEIKKKQFTTVSKTYKILWDISYKICARLLY